MHFGHFELIDRLHEGRIAETFLARSDEDVEGDELVIVKRLLPELKNNPRFQSIFHSDAETALRLDHPNIVRALSSEDIEGWPTLVVERLVGLPCSKLIEQCQTSGLELSGTEAVFIVNEALQALNYLHNHSDSSNQPLALLHGELGQECVYILADGTVKLDCICAGNAKQHTQRASALSNRGRSYRMAPEQVLGIPIDYRVDIFNAAVLLAEFLIRRPLFIENSHLSTLLAIRDVKLSPLEENKNRLPPRMEPILLRALSKDHLKRFASATEMSEALLPFAGFLTNEELRVELAELVSAIGSTDLAQHSADSLHEDPTPLPGSTESPDDDDIHTRPTPRPEAVEEEAIVEAGESSIDLEPMVEAEQSQRPSNLATINAPSATELTSERPTVMASDETIKDLVGASKAHDELVLDEPTPTPGWTPSPSPAPKPTASQRILYTPEPQPPIQEEEAKVPLEDQRIELDTGQDDDFWNDDVEEDSTLNLPIGSVSFRRPDGSVEGPFNFPTALDKIFIGEFTGDDEASVDGGSFQYVDQIQAFDQYFESHHSAPEAQEGPPEVDLVPDDLVDESQEPDQVTEVDVEATEDRPDIDIVSERRRDEPRRQGFLDVEPVSRILYDLRHKQETCLIVFEHGPIKKDVFLQKGDPIHVESNIASESLSEHLIRRDVISRMELEMAMAMRGKFNNSLGETLVGLGLMDAPVFVGLTRDHIRSVLIDLFKWSKGEYRVFLNRSTPELMVRTGLPTFSIILEGLRNKMDAKQCHLWTQEHAGDVVSRQMSPEEMLGRLKLPDISATVLRSLKVPRSIIQIVEDYGADRESRQVIVLTLRLAEELSVIDITPAR